MVEDFYQLASGDGIEALKNPVSSPAPENPALEAAIDRSVHYKDDQKIYIVRGDSLFSVKSTDVQVDRNGDLRNITILNAHMVKL